MSDTGLFTYLTAEEYTAESLAKIKEVLAAHDTHKISPLAHGLFAASSGQTADSATGYQNIWVQNIVMVVNSLRLRGIAQPAITCVQGLTQFFHKQVPRFREIIDDPVSVLKEDANRRPHIRFTAQTLSELPEKWPHAQNDALGQVLWFRMVLANSGAMAMTPIEWKTYELFPEFFGAIAILAA